MAGFNYATFLTTDSMHLLDEMAFSAWLNRENRPSYLPAVLQGVHWIELTSYFNQANKDFVKNCKWLDSVFSAETGRTSFCEKLLTNYDHGQKNKACQRNSEWAILCENYGLCGVMKQGFFLDNL